MTEYVTLKGPIFHHAHQLLDQLEQDLVDVVSDRAERVVQTNLASSLRHPTGHYQGQVTTDRSVGDSSLVTDQGVVYGPWLEGVSSRNTTTRFKGYQSFRRATQLVRRQVPDLAEPVLADIVRRFNA